MRRIQCLFMISKKLHQRIIASKKYFHSDNLEAIHICSFDNVNTQLIMDTVPT